MPYQNMKKSFNQLWSKWYSFLWSRKYGSKMLEIDYCAGPSSQIGVTASFSQKSKVYVPYFLDFTEKS